MRREAEYLRKNNDTRKKKVYVGKTRQRKMVLVKLEYFWSGELCI